MPTFREEKIRSKRGGRRRKHIFNHLIPEGQVINLAICSLDPLDDVGRRLCDYVLLKFKVETERKSSAVLY